VAPHHVCLERDQSDSGGKADRDDCQPGLELRQRVLHEEALHRLADQRNRRAREEVGLQQGRQGFGLAVAKAVLAVGRLLGVPHAEKGDDGRDEVDGRVDD
jgi:hypothetical protein